MTEMNTLEIIQFIKESKKENACESICKRKP